MQEPQLRATKSILSLMELASVSDIAERTACCLEMFQNLAFASDFEYGASVSRGFRDQLDSFKLWASNIDVFAEVQLSLDFRVRELPDVKRLFMRHLRTIESRLALSMLSQWNPPLKQIIYG